MNLLIQFCVCVALLALCTFDCFNFVQRHNLFLSQQHHQSISTTTMTDVKTTEHEVKASADAAQSKPPTTIQTLLSSAAFLTQSHAPLAQFTVHLVSTPFYADRPSHPIVWHHYCSAMSADMLQCLMFDSDKKDARFIGNEWVITEQAFQALPADEKKLWHTHHYEIESGITVAPGLPREYELMDFLSGTYGKAVCVWPPELPMPLGAPKLMMTMTDDETMSKYMPEEVIREKDKQSGLSTDETRRSRESIPRKPRNPDADQWRRTGVVCQFQIGETKISDERPQHPYQPQRSK